MPTIIDIDQQKLNCQVTKSSPDKSWLVFSNSLLTDLSIWEDQVNAFSSSYNVLCYDQRGHGNSSVPNMLPTMDVLSQDLLNLLDHFDIEKCTYVGLSMGVPTGLGAYKLQPGRFEGLVLCDGLAKPSEAGIKTWGERINQVRKTGVDAYVDDTLTRWFPATFSNKNEKRLAEFGRMMKQTSIEGLAVGVNALQNFDHDELLSEINVPVLTMAGEFDGAMPTIMEKMASRIPGAQYATIADAGHIPNVANPIAFNTQLSSFLRAIS
jgi:3-oxoadipate enol-lactonase